MTAVGLSARSGPAARRWWRELCERAEALTPVTQRPTAGRRSTERMWPGVAVLVLLDLNDAVLRRWGPPERAWWDVTSEPWARDLEAAWPAVRLEVDALLARRPAPPTARLNGLVEGPGGPVPGGEGTWRTLLLQSFGRPVAGNARHMPATMAALRRVPARANVGLSVLEPGARIDLHCDPNRGALRYQLPIVVPDGARITVAGEEHRWAEGRGVCFDLALPHEAVNESSEPRVVLAMEVLMPLPAPLSWLNRCAQRAYRHLPTYRGLVDRAEVLARGVGDQG